MNKRKRVGTAPYNFVPLPEKIIDRYSSISKLPTHNAKDDRDKHLLCGEVHFDIVAKSPILIADGNAENGEGRHFVKNACNEYEIPGSSLRGLLRSTMSILSLSRWTDQIDDEIFYYRTVGESSSKLATTYKNILDVDQKEHRGKMTSIERNVRAGYIVKNDEDNYVIYPARTDGGRHGKSYYKFHQQNVNRRFINEFKKKLRDGYRVEDATFSVNQHGEAVYLNGRDAIFKGKLFFSGPMKGKKTAYVINDIDKQAKPIPISDKDLKAYKADYEFRKNKLRGRGKSFFQLPSETGLKGAKPCFYIYDGSMLHFGYTAYLRLTYDKSTIDALPSYLKRGDVALDYVKALFGFTEEDLKGREGEGKLTNYASRLSFFPSLLKEESIPLDPMNFVLASPRASALTMYLDQHDGHDYNSYNDKDARLRGMKQYWIKPRPDFNEQTKKSNVTSELNLLPEQSTFKAKIRFDQIYPDELGLLLWALQGPTYHQLGMGKPYGYGVVQFTNATCHINNNEQMYRDLEAFFDVGLKEVDIETYIDRYHDYVQEHFNIDLSEVGSIMTFLNMKEKSPLPEQQMKYMNFHGYRKKHKLPTVEQLLSGKYKENLKRRK